MFCSKGKMFQRWTKQCWSGFLWMLFLLFLKKPHMGDLQERKVWEKTKQLTFGKVEGFSQYYTWFPNYLILEKHCFLCIKWVWAGCSAICTNEALRCIVWGFLTSKFTSALSKFSGYLMEYMQFSKVELRKLPPWSIYKPSAVKVLNQISFPSQYFML